MKQQQLLRILGIPLKKKKDDRIHTYGVCRCLKVILETLESSNKEESGL